MDSDDEREEAIRLEMEKKRAEDGDTLVITPRFSPKKVVPYDDHLVDAHILQVLPTESHNALPYAKYKHYDWDANNSDDGEDTPEEDSKVNIYQKGYDMNYDDVETNLENADDVDEIYDDRPKIGMSKVVSPSAHAFFQASEEQRLKYWQITIPEPPSVVSAVGKDGCAIVWFPQPLDSEGMPCIISSYEIRRYRLEATGEWSMKGSLIIKDTDGASEIEKRCYIIENLTNDCQYKFTVFSSNKRGKGLESSYSNIVMVESPLPCGWFKWYDNKSNSFFYTNIKTKQSLWKRPELNPYFLDESIYMTFSRQEVAHLTELYDEEIIHFTKITSNGMRRLLLECGEHLRLHRIERFFEEVSHTNKHDSINNYQEFMYTLAIIKHKNVIKDQEKSWERKLSKYINSWILYFNQDESLWDRITGEAVKRRAMQTVYGPWRREYSRIADRYFYRHTSSKQSRWDVPYEVRFYLSTKIEHQLLQHFTPLDIEEFKVRFAYLDLDGSGAIEEKELAMLLEGTLGIFVSASKRRKLIKEIDLNGNGLIEFEEFCYMLMCIHTKTGVLSKEWSKIDIMSADRKKLDDLTSELLSALFSSTFKYNGSENDLLTHTGTPSTHHVYKSMTEKFVHCCCAIVQLPCVPCTYSVDIFLQQCWFKREYHYTPLGALCTDLCCPKHHHPHGPYCMCGCRALEDDGRIFQFDTKSGSKFQNFLDYWYASD